MLNRALNVDSDHLMKRRTVTVTCKSEKRTLQTWKVTYEAYLGLWGARIKSLFFSDRLLCSWPTSISTKLKFSF